MNGETFESIELAGRRIDYRLVRSKTARKLRVRISVEGIEVIQPQARKSEEVMSFLRANEAWITSQLTRVERFRSVRKPQRNRAGEILFRGELTPLRLENRAHWRGANRIVFEDGCIIIIKSHASQTPVSKSLKNWLRKQARTEIEYQVDVLTRKLKRFPQGIYVMSQRTKWGNCSALHNLSFNWRLIMAPDFVLRYLVTHEVVHLVVPDHSKKFWLTLRSICPDMEKAKQWLSANGRRLLLDIDLTCVIQ
jgi:predicted metal-dependent hydrolase